ncbi:hypothetical protein CR513_40379, partial [Mucuna pruriens]
MNRILIDRVRCMLSKARLPKCQTRFGLTKMSSMIICESLIVRLLCMFQRMKRSKLDMKTRQCIFIGYGHDEYGYRMYDPVEKKLVRSRDV